MKLSGRTSTRVLARREPMIENTIRRGSEDYERTRWLEPDHRAQSTDQWPGYPVFGVTTRPPKEG